MFLAVRLYCSLVMEYDIHTILDSATLGTTLWVIYMIRFKLMSSYMDDKDNFRSYYVVSVYLLILKVKYFQLDQTILVNNHAMIIFFL